MTQNRSAAVMQQRHEAPDSLDFFPTPPWATRALTEWLLNRGHRLHLMSAWEPACGMGDMAKPLSETFDRVTATDVRDYGWPGLTRVQDFLLDWPGDPMTSPDWIITNPPFVLGEEFVRRALDLASEGVAMFVRTAFLESEARWRLFREARPAAVLQFVERVVLWKGRVVDPDTPIADHLGRMRKPTTATSYCWIIWRRDHLDRCELDWIAPCRKRLTRPGDYVPPPAADHFEWGDDRALGL